ncbi:hypothetical protein BJY04DRAFT_221504 [Aspergillus karnatakaensis]|uniref:Zn(II)2Cys6 transcription factor domain-containing protein n=1 Tax=Aspergillus karnatakaensis TaxID=1810916 RepID=UPI003CCD504E
MPNGEFQCGICNKTYSRRDLRDRHRRRCIKTIDQQRRSKRKSCDACVQKKLRCSMSRPSCSRCLQTGLQCHYPLPAFPTAKIHDTASLALTTPSDPFATIDPSFLQDRAQDLQLPDISNSNTSADQDTPQDGGINPRTAFVDTTFPNLDLMAPISWNEEFSISSLLVGQDETFDLPSSLPRALSLDQSTQPAFDNNSKIRSSVTTSTRSPTIENTGKATRRGDNGSPHVDPNLDSSAQLTFAHDFHPRFNSLKPDDIEDLYQEMLRVFREYPSLILQRDHWSPFVHHQLYRCSTGGMAKPIGVALACLSAHAGSSGSNYGFVDNLINQEREQLVRNFTSFLDTPENCLAAVHAVCVYQILGLFGDSFLPAAIKPTTGMEDVLEQRRRDCERQAELHSSFILKMARRLYKHYRPSLLTPHDAELNWERWKFAESIRRNIFLASMINILGARAGELNSTYFEPLDDEAILTLPLPAPECMWRACSLREWLDAREHALGMSPMRAEIGEQSTRKLNLTLKELFEEEENGGVDVNGLTPLTRVIMASMKIAPVAGY